MGRPSGAVAEEIAALFLEMTGYRILGRNVRHGRLEVDLIAQRGATIAFVEVRLRSSRACGAPEETVRHRKAQALRCAAEGIWPRLQPAADARPRIDLIAVERRGFEMRLRHHLGFVRPH